MTPPPLADCAVAYTYLAIDLGHIPVRAKIRPYLCFNDTFRFCRNDRIRCCVAHTYIPTSFTTFNSEFVNRRSSTRFVSPGCSYWNFLVLVNARLWTYFLRLWLYWSLLSIICVEMYRVVCISFLPEYTTQRAQYLVLRYSIVNSLIENLPLT